MKNSLSALSFAILLLGAACNNEDTYYFNFENDTSQFETANLIVKVIDISNGNEISDVSISVSGQQSNSNELGIAFFEELSVTSNQLKISATINGYAPAFNNVNVNRKNCITEIALVPLQTNTFNSNLQQFIDFENSDAQVIFPSNAFINQNGEDYNGTVTVKMAYIEPNQTNFGQAMLGGDFRGINSEGNEQFLVSYGAVSIELFAENGEELQLTEGKQATLRLPFPNGYTDLPNQIPMWYFDEEENTWMEEGIATLNGNEYVAQVSHFTWWNCDDPVDPKTFVQGTVIDCDGEPVEGITVKVGPLIVYTDENGFFQTNVAPDLTFTIKIFNTNNIYLNLTNQIVSTNEIYDVGIIEPYELSCEIVHTYNTSIEFFDCDNNSISPFYYCNKLQPPFGNSSNININQFNEYTELDILLLSHYDTLLQVIVDSLPENQDLQFVICGDTNETTDTTTIEEPNNLGCCNADLLLNELSISIDSIANSFCEFNFINDSIFYLTMVNPTGANVPFIFSLYCAENIVIGENYALGKSVGFAATFNTSNLLPQVGTISFSALEENKIAFTINSSGANCTNQNVNCSEIYDANNLEQAANLIAFQYLVNESTAFNTVTDFINGLPFTEFATTINGDFCISN